MYRGLAKGQVLSGCINTPQLGQRFCPRHIHDHREQDKDVVVGDLKQAYKEFGATLGPILKGGKRKVESKEFGQV